MVKWEFLDYILGRMGFGVQWRKWIHAYVVFASFSIIVNGAPKVFFSSSKRLRQGDQLSPLLFVIVVEGLSRMLQKANEVGLVRILCLKLLTFNLWMIPLFVCDASKEDVIALKGVRLFLVLKSIILNVRC